MMLTLLLEALTPLLPASTPEVLVSGLTGRAFLRSEIPLRAHDLLTLVFPGGLGLGASAELIAVTSESRWKAVLRDRLRTMPFVPAIRFSASLPDPPEPPESPPRNPYACDFPETMEPILEDLTLVTAHDENLYYHHRVRGETETIREAEFARTFTHVLRLGRTGERGFLHDVTTEAITRMLAYSAAYPDRVFGAGERGAPMREAWAEFLFERGAKERNRWGTALKKAASALQSGDAEEMFSQLRRAVLPELQLPTSVEDALLNPEKPLSPVQRRELIYLGRAGLPIPRTLIAVRLHPEADRHPDLAKTLHQMRYDSFPWVRAAALPPSLAFPVPCR